ncbi:MAG: hypothetical protein BroJett030_32350 [Alphaproteobacteria bacterium]|nr:MAG: hypothetical protein BroJett030_32350 [Alphaproteobacteria bacterium]
MKTLPAGLAAHVAGEVTTLCRCWKLIRADGAVLGFTDHDRDVDLDGLACEALSGLGAGELEQSVGLNADTQEVAGALSSDRISADDLHAGLYDGARVELWIVNWSTPAERVLDRVLTIGEVVAEDGAFRAELRALSVDMDETRGRSFSRACDADLGDARCGIDLDQPQCKGAGTVVRALSDLVVEVSGLGGFLSGWFRGGRLAFSSGANAGLAVEVAEHMAGDGTVVLHLWQPPARPLAAGDGFTVRAGCDKAFATCREKFANGINFRGFPHIPGNDFALGYAAAFRQMDGGPIVP